MHLGSIFKKDVEVLHGDVGDLRVIEALPFHLLGDGEEPHPHFPAQHLPHVFQPKHVKFIGHHVLRGFKVETRIPEMSVAKSFESSDIVIDLKQDGESQEDQGPGDGDRQDIGLVVASIAKGSQLMGVLFPPEECVEDHHRRVDQSYQALVEAEEEEVFEVVIAHTVADPGTVVVHLEHALLADGTVVGSLRLPVLAHVAGLHRIRRHGLRDLLGLPPRCPQV